LPQEKALAAWTRVADGFVPKNGLSDAQMAIVRIVADSIIPRTDTPSATDVGTHQFINVIVAEYANDDERKAFVGALDAIDSRARAVNNGTAFADLSPEARGKELDVLEKGDRNVEPSQSYWRLKSLVVHGYFTSEHVMKDVLRVQVMPGRFEGSVPVEIRKRPLQAGTPKQEQHEEEHIHG
ncbi:MAG TPA: gluconate 2-dehydrogenase subunit 3 family protein, partial [Gemmatimonadaceae bacterium]|nr:gluconate 2-dehydrogenase subunit 3 family protein [Gemmatimonadaceae bacterium]